MSARDDRSIDSNPDLAAIKATSPDGLREVRVYRVAGGAFRASAYERPKLDGRWRFVGELGPSESGVELLGSWSDFLKQGTMPSGVYVH